MGTRLVRQRLAVRLSLFVCLLAGCAEAAHDGSAQPQELEVARSEQALFGIDNLSGFLGPVAYSTVASNERGDTIAAWVRTVSSDRSKLGPGSIRNVLETRFRPAGGTWGPSTRVSTDQKFVIFPSAVVDDQGRAHVAWLEQTNQYDIVAAQRDFATGKWSVPHNITPSNTQAMRQESSELAVDAKGNVVVVYRALDLGMWTAFSARFDANTKSWSSAQAIQPQTDDIAFSAFAMDARGHSYFAYVETLDAVEARRVIRLVRRLPGADSAWLPPEHVADTEGYSADGMRLAVAADGAGNVVVAWNDPRVAGAGDVVRAAFRDASTGVFGARVTLSAEQTGRAATLLGGATPSVVFDADGTAFVAWNQLVADGNRSKSRVQVARRKQATGVWSAAQTLSSESDSAGLTKLAADAHGDVALIWLRAGFWNQVVQRTFWSGEKQRWSENKDLFRIGFGWNIDMAMDASGRTTAIWMRTAEGLGLAGIVEATTDSAR